MGKISYGRSQAAFVSSPVAIATNEAVSGSAIGGTLSVFSTDDDVLCVAC